MLKLGWVARTDRDDATIDMQLTHHRAAGLQFRSKCVVGQFTQSQQSNENVLRWVFVRQKRFPAFVADIITTHQLNLRTYTSDI